MKNKLRVVVCGGGNLGHAIVGKISQQSNVSVSLLTSNPSVWDRHIEVIENNGDISHGKIESVDSQAEFLIPDADVIIITTPSFLIKDMLLSISPYVKVGTWVGSVQCSGGFFGMARTILASNVNIFGFQRVPYIARVKEYGKSVFLKGYKSEIKIAVLNTGSCDEFMMRLEELFETKIIRLKSYLEATLTNSNPILHPSRLYGLFKDWKPGIEYEEEVLFYEDWTNRDSEILIACDQELALLVSELSDYMDKLPSILEHYGVSDKYSLTYKLQTIEAFKGIRLKMSETKSGKYIPDFKNRYFIEDVSYGLLLIRHIADTVHVDTPMINVIINWAQQLMGSEYLVGNELKGKDFIALGLPSQINL
ncbi:NAD/NADP octopine/nopaline dehydrogenase family protein [Ancylomarina sp. YFZ004]